MGFLRHFAEATLGCEDPKVWDESADQEAKRG